MANNPNKYAGLEALRMFLDNLKDMFAVIGHKHEISDLTDYTVDTALSPTSTNPVQNKIIDAEFEAVSVAMNALDSAIDGKANSSHNHNDTYYTKTQIDTSLSEHSHSTHIQQSMSNTNLNDIKTAGWYYGNNGMENAPEQVFAVMEVIRYSQNWIVQKFYVIDNNGKEYIRYFHSASTWTDWKVNVRSDNIATQSVKYATSAGSAIKAAQDENGNVISSTYATKTELDNIELITTADIDTICGSTVNE